MRLNDFAIFFFMIGKDFKFFLFSAMFTIIWQNESNHLLVIFATKFHGEKTEAVKFTLNIFCTVSNALPN